jgi:hypothetical protein
VHVEFAQHGCPVPPQLTHVPPLQICPLAQQAWLEPEPHTLPLSQHAWFTHVCVLEQVWQKPPPLPQLLFAAPCVHRLLVWSQQPPLVQSVPLAQQGCPSPPHAATHAPFTQLWPEAQQA